MHQGAVTATAVGSTQVNLSWGAATDNVAVTIYRVERCTGAGCTTFSEIGTATGLTYGDTGLSASTTYRYQVRAGDAAGNLGTIYRDCDGDDRDRGATAIGVDGGLRV